VTLGPGALADTLGALPVRVQAVHVQRRPVTVGDYPGARPSSVVRLSGRGQVGRGENVAFSDEDQARFEARAPSLLSARSTGDVWSGTVASLLDGSARDYGRAALEAALIDLALRQAERSLGTLAGVSEASVRVVLSFAARPDAAAYARALRAAGRREALKIDVDPAWTTAAVEALALEPDVAVLDFKGRGDARLATMLSPRFPAALFEDPPPGTAHQHIARDAPLGDAAAVGATLARGEAANLKAPRMGGPLEVLRALELARRTTPAAVVYLGGMFEVDVGRTQARQLAALFCPDGPNDLAPLQEPAGAPRLTIRLDTPGFG